MNQLLKDSNGRWRLLDGDCTEVMAGMDAASVDAVICDPPYGLEFMGKDWDRPWAVSAEYSVGYAGRDTMTLPSHRDGRNANCRRCNGRARGNNRCACPEPLWDRAPSQDMRDFQAWSEVWAREALRVLKPGGHLLAFGGTRTCHRLTAGIEDAGFEIRDMIAWLYGSGFPKSMDVSKAIDKAAGAEREIVGSVPDRWTQKGSVLNFSTDRPQESVPLTGAPVTDAAAQAAGWGTALKPALEPVTVARKPLTGTVAANFMEHGTGAINIDGCRIAGSVESRDTPPVARASTENWRIKPGLGTTRPEGRWPANLVLDEDSGALLDEQTGELTSGANPTRRGSDKFRDTYGDFKGQTECEPARGADSGGASRFFYCAKADGAERHAGLGGDLGLFSMVDAPDRNNHPTVKPMDLMRWLVRLVTPPDGLVLDPFAGSGTTGIAAVLEGFRFVGIEREADYARIARARLSHWTTQREVA